MKEMVHGLTQICRGERGIALSLALMCLMVLASLSAAMLAIGGSEVQIAANLLRDTQARFIAEAGLEDAFNYYRSDTSRLPASNATLSATVTDVTSNLSGPGTGLQGYGSYAVTAQIVGPYTVLLTSTGTSATGSASKMLRALLTIGFVSKDAVRTEGTLQIAGTAPTVTGTCGSAHTNRDLDVSGSASPTFSQGVTASGSADPPGTGAQARRTIPAVRASDFLAEAKLRVPLNQIFVMKADGAVYDGNDPANLLFTYSAGPPKLDTFQGWKYDPGSGSNPAEWTTSAGVTTGTYYFETSVQVQGGTSAATILSNGDITVSGNAVLSPHLTDTLLVADKDIDLGGTSGSSVSGLVAAREQIKLSGNVAVTGYLLAENAAATSSTVTTNSMSGSVSVTYDCNLSPPMKGPVRFIAWGV